MVPNSVVLNVAVMPLREPEAVNLRARLRAGMTPGDLQEVLERSLQTPLRDAPRITLEELDGEEAIVRIAATPRVASQGRQVASELLVGRLARDALSGRDAVAQEQVGVAAQDVEQLEARRAGRARSRPGSAAPRPPAGSPPASSGERDRNSSSTSPAPSSWRARWGPPSQSTVCTAKRSASSGRAAGRSSWPSPARRYSTLAGAGARLAAEAVRTATRALGLPQQGQLRVDRQAARDDAGQRLLGQPALERAGRGRRGRG